MCTSVSFKDKLLEEIIEVSCGALHMLAKDPGIRVQIASMKVSINLILIFMLLSFAVMAEIN